MNSLQLFINEKYSVEEFSLCNPPISSVVLRQNSSFELDYNRFVLWTFMRVGCIGLCLHDAVAQRRLNFTRSKFAKR